MAFAVRLRAMPEQRKQDHPITQARGKLSPEEFERLIASHLGAPRAEVIVGPRIGTDTGVVRIGAGRVMAVTTDPLSLIPALGPELSARLSCQGLASDAWTSGIPPAYATLSFHLPPELEPATLAAYVAAMGEEWNRLGVAVVGGHTGRYDGCGLTIVGAGTLIGVGDEGRTVGPSHVQPGDRVIVTKGCAIEATAIAARLFPKRLSARLEEDGLQKALSLLDRLSVVEDCTALLRVGVRDRGVSCLHDATEGGVLGGLVELARACEHDLRVEQAKIPLGPEAKVACEVFGIDPYWTLSQGTLIATVRPDRGLLAMAALEEMGIAAADVGEVVRGAGKLWLTAADGQVRAIREPEPDPYWPAYARAVSEGWS
jgi:hydrogenase expression/formation protein HypE